MLFRLILVSAPAFGCQKKEEPISDFSKLYTIKANFEQKSSELVVDISLDKKIHAYALGEKVGIPLRVEISNKNGWQTLGQANIPKGQVRKLKSLGESVVLLGDIQVRQKLKKGQGPGEGNLFMQVCSQNTCDRPRVHPLNF